MDYLHALSRKIFYLLEMPRIKSTKASLRKTLINKVQECVDVIPQSMGKVKQKWNSILNKNPGFDAVKK